MNVPLDNLRIDIDRLMSRIRRLGAVGALDGGGVCRLALSDADRQGRDLVVEWMRELGMDVHIDGIGNVIAVRPGSEEGPPVMTGSHIDTVRTGGLYDGNLGVLAGLEVISVLNDAGIQTRRPLSVAFFTNEEGARFAPDMMGSLVFQGDMTMSAALDVEGIEGSTVSQCLDEIGYRGTLVTGGKFPVHAFVELHIEQGPVLEEKNIPIGAVEGVQGISWMEYTIIGTSNHAGTTPMRLRHDAGYVAAETIAFVRRLAGEFGGDQVATVGSIAVKPNLVNVVPNKVVFTVDLRNTDEALLQKAEAQTQAFITATAGDEGCDVSFRKLARFEPVAFDLDMISRVEAAARDLDLSVRRMPSGAGHDAQILARMCPSGMIFVPSVGGISHNITEHTDQKHIEDGANVLLRILWDLASQERAKS